MYSLCNQCMCRVFSIGVGPLHSPKKHGLVYGPHISLSDTYMDATRHALDTGLSCLSTCSFLSILSLVREF